MTCVTAPGAALRVGALETRAGRRTVLHVDFGAFQASVEQLDDPRSAGGR